MEPRAPAPRMAIFIRRIIKAPSRQDWATKHPNFVILGDEESKAGPLNHGRRRFDAQALDPSSVRVTTAETSPPLSCEGSGPRATTSGAGQRLPCPSARPFAAAQGDKGLP